MATWFVRLMKKGELQGEAGEWAECMDRFVKKSLEKTAITAAEEMVSSLRSKCTELTRQYKENSRVLDTLKDKVKEKLRLEGQQVNLAILQMLSPSTCMLQRWKIQISSLRLIGI